MTSRLRKSAFVIIAIMWGATACNLPGSAAPSVSPATPDLTITALFEFITTAQSAQSATPMPPTQAQAAPSTATPSVTPPPTSTNTPTVRPTDTAEPTDTEEPSSGSSGGGTSRRGPELVANYLQKEPTIDGNFDEDVWDQERYDVDNVVYGDDHVSGSNDLSGTVMVGWDDNYLYIAARVKDDKYVQNAHGKNLFKGDSVEIMLDANLSRDFNRRSLDGDDYQLGISPGESEPSEDTEAYLWYPSSKDGTYDNVVAAAVATGDGYRLEAKIPWSIFGVNPNIGKHYGFAFSISDNDKSGDNVQQSMVSSAPNRHLTDPTTWGELTLEGHQ